MKEKLKSKENEEECKRGDRWKDKIKKIKEAQGKEGDGKKKQRKIKDREKNRRGGRWDSNWEVTLSICYWSKWLFPFRLFSMPLN